MPAELKVYKVIYPVQTYFPQVRQCYRRYKFRHIKQNCKSANEICIRCVSVKHDEKEKCPLTEAQPICLHCKNNHLPIDKTCPDKIKEQQIKDTATKLNFIIAEVKKHFNNNYMPNSKTTYQSTPATDIPAADSASQTSYHRSLQTKIYLTKYNSTITR